MHDHTQLHLQSRRQVGDRIWTSTAVMHTCWSNIDAAAVTCSRAYYGLSREDAGCSQPHRELICGDFQKIVVVGEPAQESHVERGHGAVQQREAREGRQMHQ